MSAIVQLKKEIQKLKIQFDEIQKFNIINNSMDEERLIQKNQQISIDKIIEYINNSNSRSQKNDAFKIFNCKTYEDKQKLKDNKIKDNKFVKNILKQYNGVTRHECMNMINYFFTQVSDTISNSNKIILSNCKLLVLAKASIPHIFENNKCDIKYLQKILFEIKNNDIYFKCSNGFKRIYKLIDDYNANKLGYNITDNYKIDFGSCESKDKVFINVVM